MSFNDFFEERRINSCPVVSAETDDNDDSRAAEPQPLRRAITAGAQALMTSVASAAGFWKQSEHEATLEPMENLHISTPTDSLHGWTVQNFHIPPPLQSVQVPQPMEMSYVSQPIENCQPIQPMENLHFVQPTGNFPGFHVLQPFENFQVAQHTENSQVVQPTENFHGFQVRQTVENFQDAQSMQHFQSAQQQQQQQQRLQQQQQQQQQMQQQMPMRLMLSEALPEAQFGSVDLPTVGSLGHHVGTCKPCAFLHTKGCCNGAQCPFCHLCAPDEKRKRQKQKQAAFRELHRQRRQVRL